MHTNVIYCVPKVNCMCVIYVTVVVVCIYNGQVFWYSCNMYVTIYVIVTLENIIIIYLGYYLVRVFN